MRLSVDCLLTVYDSIDSLSTTLLTPLNWLRKTVIHSHVQADEDPWDCWDEAVGDELDDAPAEAAAEILYPGGLPDHAGATLS